MAQQQLVHQPDLDKVDCRQRHTAEGAHPDLLPDDPEKVLELHVAQTGGADDRDAGLAAGVAADAHQHGDEAGQGGAGGQLIFKRRQNNGGKGGADHQDGQPRDAAFPGLKDAGLEIGPFGGDDGGHLFHVLRGLVLHDVHHVVHGDQADQPVLLIHHRHGQQVVAVEQVGHVLLVVGGDALDDVVLHDAADLCLVRVHQQILDGDNALQMALFIRHKQDVDRFGVLSVGPDIVERVVYLHLLFQGEVLGGHNAAGGVVRIPQKLVDEVPGLGFGVFQHAPHHAGRQLLQHIDRVIHIEVFYDVAQLGISEGVDDDLLNVRG